jgi:hypothetical protein
MARERVNPFDQGTAERTLFDRYRKHTREAQCSARSRDLYAADAEAHRAAADKFADALRALGHGDKVPGQGRLADHSKEPA